MDVLKRYQQARKNKHTNRGTNRKDTWSQAEDQLCFEVKSIFTTKRKHTSKSKSDVIPTQIPQQLTKHIILSQINSVYDPLGLAGPLTVRAKILLRRLWGTEQKLDWDDLIPEENQQNWSIFLNDLRDMNQIRFTRCFKPMDAIGEPILIVFSDASKDAYAACAYVRWQRKNNQFESNLILSKNRLAPIKKMSIDRVELCGAVLNRTRLSDCTRYDTETFIRVQHVRSH